MEHLLLEKIVPKQVIPAGSLHGGNMTGARIDMKNVRRVTFLIALEAGSTTTTHTFSLVQSNAASSGTSKALSVANPYYYKIGAATKFTKVDPTAVGGAGPLDTYDLHALLGDSVALVAFEVNAEDLDRANNFEWVELDMLDTGAAQVGAVIGFAIHDFAPAYAQVV
jgi:hypothetical protein